MWLEYNNYCENKQGSRTFLFKKKKTHWKRKEKTENASIIVGTEDLYIEGIVMKYSTGKHFGEISKYVFVICIFIKSWYKILILKLTEFISL